MTDTDVQPSPRMLRRDGIGTALRRTEDRRLLTGRGRYAGDLFPPNLCHAALVRSPHAHARIGSMDVSRAASLPGVLAVLTGHDAAADGLKPMPHNPDWTGPPDVELRLPSGFEIYVTPNTPLPTEIVRFVGEAVALVVAESEALAAEAAELVDVEWEPLPSVVAVREAMREEALRLWPDCHRNLPLTCDVGDQTACDHAFAEAAHVVRLDSRINRVTGCPLEPRAVVGDYDAASKPPPPPLPSFATEEERLEETKRRMRQTRDTYLRLGRSQQARRVELELAHLEKREPDAAIVDAPSAEPSTAPAMPRDPQWESRKRATRDAYRSLTERGMLELPDEEPPPFDAIPE